MTNTRLIHDFVAYWTGKGYEKGESQPFWIALLHALGIEEPTTFITFEQQVHIDHTAFIDGFIPATKVLIEQKSVQKDLGAPIRQSDGSLLNPFQQAKRYAAELPYSQRPRWIVTSNFREFWIYDMEQPNGEPQVVLLENLEKEHYRLRFLVDTGSDTLRKEMELSIQAGDLVGKIYDAIRPQYAHPDAPDTLASLNQLCVRLVFCLFAEDAGLFGDKNEFHDYLNQFPAPHLRRALIDLFRVLDTKPEDRDPYLDDDLRQFPYVNGGLFSNENIEIPQLTDEIRMLLLTKASEDFDWSEISPTIFGAVFESTLNPDTRRSGGMHYTSIENIHKVIDPLFLNDLQHEFETITGNMYGDDASRVVKNSKGGTDDARRIVKGSTRDNDDARRVVSTNTVSTFQLARLSAKQIRDLRAFQDKLASLTFFDPACGSGNFLTETYISLRRLENKVIRLLQGDQMQLGTFTNPIRVDIHQFYGIEINDFAVSVATTALWIAELQMLRETERICQIEAKPLPLHAYHNIHEGNALQIDWSRVIYGDNACGDDASRVVKKNSVDYDDAGRVVSTPHTSIYIMGNPPFVGTKYQSASQKEDILALCPSLKPLDYVTGWYKKANDMMDINPSIHTAFVSTNSITQGEQVAPLWKTLNARIDFAYHTFRWDSESSLKAHVHCVIIGFSSKYNTEDTIARLYNQDGTYRQCQCINGYLLDAPLVHIEARREPICPNVPKMSKGSQPTDGGFLLMTPTEREELLTLSPQFEPYIKRYMGADDLINDTVRYCLWLKNCSPALLRSSSIVMQRLEGVKEARLKSTKASTREWANRPYLFTEDRQPDRNYIILPVVSSERRRYIPMMYVTKDVIANANAQMIPNGDLYTFGVLNSNVHNAWMRAVCGRLETRYAYSASIVYNNFPWPQWGDDAGRIVNNSTVGRDNDAGRVVSTNNASTNIPTSISANIVPINGILKTHGNLPHWHVRNAIQFITFRLADSLPQNQLEVYKSERATFLQQHPLPWNEETERLYHDTISNKIDEWLAAGYGSCCLRYAKVRQIVEDALLHFNNERYILHDYVIMPNHVHVLLEPVNGNNTTDILHSIKSYTAHQINDLLGTAGSVWQKESFDRVIRTEKHYQYVRDYIRHNPRNLQEGEYSLMRMETALVGTARLASLDAASSIDNNNDAGRVVSTLAAASPNVYADMVAAIEHTAQAILDARAKYPDCSLADLYDEVTMPIELRRAHQANDRAVMAAYGFPTTMTESDCVARLLEMYRQLIKKD